MRRSRTGLCTLCLTVAGVLAAPSTSAFCRTTTVKVPSDYDPSVSGCWTEGVPVYWASACISYDLQKDASAQVPYDVAAQAIASAFSTWTQATCPGSAGGSGGAPSIGVVDLGPVSCGLVQYDQTGPNQHVIVFRDSSWPYDDSSNALAMTTVSYDVDTGEIYDADVEVNTSDYVLSTAATVPPGGYDFESIVTHEMGHFLGLAHSQLTDATMYAHYTPGSEAMRLLSTDDIEGICTIYLPDRERSVSKDASASGLLAEGACDPTPRHGFTTECDGGGVTTVESAGSSGCSVRGTRAPRGGSAALVALVLALCARRRRAHSAQ